MKFSVIHEKIRFQYHRNSLVRVNLNVENANYDENTPMKRKLEFVSTIIYQNVRTVRNVREASRKYLRYSTGKKAIYQINR